MQPTAAVNLRPADAGEFAAYGCGEFASFGRWRIREDLCWRIAPKGHGGSKLQSFPDASKRESSVFGFMAPKSSYNNNLETLDSRFKHSVTTGGGSGPQISKRTLNSANAIEFLNVSFTKRGIVRPMDASTMILNLRGPLAANSPRCEASKFPSDERREFPAARRLQIPRPCPFVSTTAQLLLSDGLATA